MIYTDGVHLISDSDLEELHDFAVNKLGFKRSWFQDNSPAYCPHYDLTTSRAKKRAITSGATLVTDLKEFVQLIHNTPTYLKWQEERKNKKAN